jgi:hypothetical protein
MVVVRSVSTCTSSDAGRWLQLGQQGLDAVDRVDHVGAGLAADVEDDASLGAVSGVPAQAARRVFSASSTVCATSRRRTGAPFLKARMRSRYSCADV